MPDVASGIILGLDTATHTASAALVDRDGALLAQGTLDTSGRGDDLLVLLDDLCRRVGVAPSALAAVAVGAGPGSFTGLRIGMATAKGVAFAAGCPLWIASSLAAMADEANEANEHLRRGNPGGRADRADRSDPCAVPDVVVPVLDARRGEVFCAFHAAAPGAPALGPERVLAPEQLAGALAETLGPDASGRTVWCCGDALDVYGEALAALAPRWLQVARTPSGLHVARTALRGARHDDLSAGRPAYLRPAEAEVMYPDGVPGALRKVTLPDSP